MLELPALSRGLPEVVAGQEALGRHVRWVHVLDVQDPSDLLRGGELVLSTGFGAGKDPKGQQRFVQALAQEGASGLVIELGWTFDRTLAAEPHRCANAVQLPVIALHRQLRFVEVTEAIHGVLLDRQLSLLRRADELQDRFIEIVLAGEGASSVLTDLSRLIGNPVVLEDHAHRLVDLALHDAGREAVLTAWEQHHRAEDRQDRSDADAAVARCRCAAGRGAGSWRSRSMRRSRRPTGSRWSGRRSPSHWICCRSSRGRAACSCAWRADRWPRAWPAR